MSGRSGWRIDVRRAAAFACLSACSFAAAWLISLAIPGLCREMDGHAFDLLQVVRYRLQGRGVVSPYLVHVVVTDESRRELGLAGWDRRAYGRALRMLQRLNARTIACDVFFKDESFSDNDALLLESARAGRKILFPLLAVSVFPPDRRQPGPASADTAAPPPQSILRPVVVREGIPPTAIRVVPPFHGLAEAAGRLGHINLAPDRDGVSRRVPLLYRYTDAFIPSLALAAALQFLEVEPADVTVAFGTRILLRGARMPSGRRADIAIPIDGAGRMIADPVGPWNDSFAAVPIQALLRAEADNELRSRLRDLVEGSLAVLSDVSTMNRDYGPGIFESVYPLSGLHVAALNSILTSRFLSEQSALHFALVMGVLAAVLWICAVKLKGLVFPSACVALYAAFLGASYGSFAFLHRVPQAGVPTVGFLLAVAVLTVYRIILAEHEKTAVEAKAESNRALERANAELVEQKRTLERANAMLRQMERSREQASLDAAGALRLPLAGLLASLESIWAGHRQAFTPAAAGELEAMRSRAGELRAVINQLLGNGHREASADSEPRQAVRHPDSLALGSAEPVLVAGSDPQTLSRCSEILGAGAIAAVAERTELEGVLQVLRERPYGALVLDYELERLARSGLVADIRDEFPSLQILVLGRSGETAQAAECIRQGAADCLVKPLEAGRLVSALGRCFEKRKIERQLRDLSGRLQAMELKNPDAFAPIVTCSPRMLSMFRYAEAIAADTNPVLITGESGSGKELMAGVLHRLSGRQGPLVCENVAGLDDAMLTDTLFGHLKGAFTDAREGRRGLVEEARGGTLFLDEIGDMPINSQVKLLRLMEGGSYRPLGSDTVRTSDARVVVATNVDLAQRLREGRFREDLYFRFTHHIEVPPLRERVEDLPLLVNRFAAESAAARGRTKPSVPKALIDVLRRYPFPGNVRELRNMVDNAVTRSTADTLPLDYFREYVQAGPGITDARAPIGRAEDDDALAGMPTLREVEGQAVGEAMRRAGGNQRLAARLLGMSPSALSRRLRKQGAGT